MHPSGLFRPDSGRIWCWIARQDAFNPNDMQSLESVADICATAIQNAHYVDRVKQLAYLDGLTGIFNRRYFELRIAEEIDRARRFGTGMAVIMVDIDQFKRLNDEFGHLLGDEVLRQVSSIFHQQLRKIDVVCRYGGEEFAILLSQTNPQHAFGVAEKLRRLVETWQFPGVPAAGHDQRGSRQLSRPRTTRDELVKAADAGLYAAKQAGRNRVLLAPHLGSASIATARQVADEFAHRRRIAACQCRSAQSSCCFARRCAVYPRLLSGFLPVFALFPAALRTFPSVISSCIVASSSFAAFFFRVSACSFPTVLPRGLLDLRLDGGHLGFHRLRSLRVSASISWNPKLSSESPIALLSGKVRVRVCSFLSRTILI